MMMLEQAFNQFVRVMEKITLMLADYVISEAEDPTHMDSERRRHKGKILPLGARSVDMHLFASTKRLLDRQDYIGYVGRLETSKSVTSFAKAIPLVLRKHGKAKFLIIGDGPLSDEIKQMVGRYTDRVKMLGFVDHNVLPTYLTELKLLVLPSKVEGLPTVVLEAMACKTPVIATPIGAIPEVIHDGKTGFIIENSSPECIATRVLEALENPQLDQIAENARKLVEDRYTYLAAVERYRKMLGLVCGALASPSPKESQ